MITLDDATTKLQLVTSTGGDCDVAVSYIDWGLNVTRRTRGSQQTAITTATTTDILAVPASTRQRQVEHLAVTNVDGALAQTVTLVKNVNGTAYKLTPPVALAVGETLVVDAQGAVHVYSATGLLKFTYNGLITGLTASNWKTFYSNGSGVLTELALGSTGQMLQSAGAAAAPVFASAWTTKLKLATETITSDNTLSNDAELAISLAASTKYVIRCVLLFNSANATMDIKFATVYSGTVTGTAQSFFRGFVAGGATGTDVESTGQAAGQVPSTAVIAATAGIGRISVEQMLTTNSAGTWAIQWAQNTSDVGALSVNYGSYIEYMAVV